MPRHEDVSKYSSNNFVSQRKADYSYRWLRLLAVVTCLVLLTLACTFTGSGSHTEPGRIVIRRHLPTLTRTPLPILTPAADKPAPEVARVTESVSANPSQTVSPVEMPTSIKFFFIPTFTPVSAVAANTPEIANSNVPATPVEIAAANPSLPTATTELPPTNTPVPIATEAPTPTSTTTEIPTPTPLPAGWVFSGMHAYPVEALNGMVFYGNLMNNTGGPQQLKEINTTLYDAQGQVIPYKKAVDQWAVWAVPQGGWVPFGVVIQDVQGVADFDLEVQSEPGGDIPREDFEFVDVNSSTEGEEYCLNGRLRNPGGQLRTYLMVTAVLYDGQDQVINYNNAFKSAPKEVIGDETLEVALCVKSRQQKVARYELRAWGL